MFRVLELLERFLLIYFSIFFALKDTLKAFDDLKTKQNSVCKSVWYVKVCIFWKCIQYAIHSDKTQMLKKFPWDKISGAEKCSFFSFASSNSSRLLLSICDSYMSWSTSFDSPNLCSGFSIFNSISLLLKFIFLFTKFKTSKFLLRLK